MPANNKCRDRNWLRFRVRAVAPVTASSLQIAETPRSRVYQLMPPGLSRSAAHFCSFRRCGKFHPRLRAAEPPFLPADFWRLGDPARNGFSTLILCSDHREIAAEVL